MVVSVESGPLVGVIPVIARPATGGVTGGVVDEPVEVFLQAQIVMAAAATSQNQDILFTMSVSY
jgi:hypothetical protein